MFEDRELVVDEGGRLALNHFCNACGFAVQNQNFGAREGAAEKVSGGALFHGDDEVFLVKRFGFCEANLFSGENGEAGAEVRGGECDRFGAFGGCGHGRQDEIDFSRSEGGNQSIKREVLDFERAFEVICQMVGEIDAQADWLSLGVRHFEGGVGEFHADAERSRFRGGGAEQRAGERGEKGSFGDTHWGARN